MSKSVYLSKNRFSLLLSVAFASFLISCKKFVDVSIPKTLLYTQNAFNSRATATSALTAIYSEIGNDNLPYNIPLITGVSADELISYSTNHDLLEFYQNGLESLNGLNQTLWSNHYKYIYQANSVIEGLQNSTGVDNKIKLQLTGEAKFIRAFCLLNLTSLYGDIPLITTTDYKKNSLAKRVSKDDVYSQIITDLKDGGNSLNANFVGIDDTSTTTERVRPTKYAAFALLARAYLYKGDWSNAEQQATSIISNTSMFDTVSLNTVFLKNNKETILQFQPVVSGYNTLEGAYFSLYDVPKTNSTVNCTSLSSQLLNSFETGDGRRRVWIKDTIFAGSSYSFPYKYRIASGSNLSEYSVALRLGEVYLIRAEARAQLGNVSGAQDDLNIIRKRAGLPKTTATTQAELLDAILHERQVELFTEWGHRWFDLKRTGKIDGVMSAYAPIKGATWNTYKQLFPIPQNERNNDPNLTQNQGY